MWPNGCWYHHGLQGPGIIRVVTVLHCPVLIICAGLCGLRIVGTAMDLHGSVGVDIGIGFSRSDYCW